MPEVCGLITQPLELPCIRVSGHRGLCLPRDYSIDGHADRLAAWRRDNVPVLSAEEEADKAARQQREPRIVRCEHCRRSIFKARGCWGCNMRRRGTP